MKSKNNLYASGQNKTDRGVYSIKLNLGHCLNLNLTFILFVIRKVNFTTTNIFLKAGVIATNDLTKRKNF